MKSSFPLFGKKNVVYAKDYAEKRNNKYCIIKKEKLTHDGAPLKTVVGSIIFTDEVNGMRIEDEYNTMSINRINEGVIDHLHLCELKDTPICLMYLTYDDIFGDLDVDNSTDKVICHTAQKNIKNIILSKYKWVYKYCKKNVKKYYKINKDISINLNYLLDDGHNNNANYLEKLKKERTRGYGGLILNGLLEELHYYYTQENKGALFQIAVPTGHPNCAKWIQIDVNITTVQKRLLNQDYSSSLMNQYLFMGLDVGRNWFSSKAYLPPLQTVLYYKYALGADGAIVFIIDNIGHEIHITEHLINGNTKNGIDNFKGLKKCELCSNRRIYFRS